MSNQHEICRHAESNRALRDAEQRQERNSAARAEKLLASVFGQAWMTCLRPAAPTPRHHGHLRRGRAVTRLG